MEQKDNNNRIVDLGLSQLYKISYENDIEEMLKTRSGEAKTDDPDLADTLFGFVRNNGYGLKSRVFFSDAIATNEIKTTTPLSLVLSTPRPTYYPNYISQAGSDGVLRGDYTTYKHSDPAGRSTNLRGWKRYPTHHQYNPQSTEGSDKMKTHILPLTAGAVFSCTIEYHNLHPAEMGALLSALTFHQTEAACHQIGMGKPYGLGQVKLAIQPTDKDYVKQMAMFECYMNMELAPKEPWVNQLFVRELLAMAIPEQERDANLKYLAKPKDFSDLKSTRGDRQYFLASVSSSTLPLSLVNSDVDRDDCVRRLNAEKAQLRPSAIPAQRSEAKQLADAIDVLLDSRSKLEEAIKAAEKRIKAQISGIDLTVIKDNPKREFKHLKEAVIDFAKNRLACTKDELASRPSPWFTDNDSIAEIEKTIRILRERTKDKNELKKWNAGPLEKHSHWEAISLWVGMPLAQQWYQQTSKS